MNVLEYNDSNYRNKQEQKEKDEFAIGFTEWAYRNEYNIGFYFKQDTMKELLEIYKKTL
jgi:hypothetical protein